MSTQVMRTSHSQYLYFRGEKGSYTLTSSMLVLQAKLYFSSTS